MASDVNDKGYPSVLVNVLIRTGALIEPGVEIGYHPAGASRAYCQRSFGPVSGYVRARLEDETVAESGKV